MTAKATIAIIMGSNSDWETMRHTAKTLEEFEIPYDKRIISAHRTPARLHKFIEEAPSHGIKLIIAAAGGAAHLAGVTAALTVMPVLGVPMESKSLGGMDSLLSTVQMPAGIPVGTLAIGKAGAINAALLAVAILAVSDEKLAQRLKSWREKQAAAIPEVPGN